MRISSPKRLIVTVLVALIALAAWYRPLQDVADAQVDAGFKRALASFATARALNAVISVIQGTEFSIEPIGVGVTLTPGQILDPINDLIEQFSVVMLVASVAFGVQKVLLAVGTHTAISLTVTCTGLIWAVLYYLKKEPCWLSKFLFVLLMMRFAIPIITVGSDWVFHNFLEADYNKSQIALNVSVGELGKRVPSVPQAQVAQPSLGDEKGLLERLKDLKDRARAVVTLPSIDLKEIKQTVESIPERVLKVIVVFIMQTIIVPIVLLWALYKSGLAVVHSMQTSQIRTRIAGIN